MDWIVWVILLVWLGILSCFDFRKKEIPHSALGGASAYRHLYFPGLEGTSGTGTSGSFRFGSQ